MQENRAIDMLLAQYGESHLHPTNKLIHLICVPAILFTVLGLLWCVHPLVALALTGASLCYYLTLSRPFAAGMLLVAGAMLLILAALPRASILPLSVAVFIFAWIGQFIGHKIEGKKPSFLDDLRFLLIGPLFVLSYLYRQLHLGY